jgi:hypothetical protein
MSGAEKLVSIMQDKRTTQGEAKTVELQKYHEWLRHRLVSERLPAGIKDKKGEDLFLSALVQSDKAIAALPEGKAPNFDPDAPDFIGKAFTKPPFARTEAQVIEDTMPDVSTPKAYNSLDELKADVGKGITREQAIKLSKEKGWIQ